MNYRLTLQYDGTEFHGWQVQGEGRTVQGELARALALINGEPVILHGSGRTDAGVHAEGQVASVKLLGEFTPERLRAALNGNLPRDLRVMEASRVADDFHARYSAVGKTYVYRVINGPVASPFWSRYALHEARLLDTGRMREAALLFLGEHDWGGFSSAQSGAKTRTRTVRGLEVADFQDERGRARMIEISATADGFLRYMVRTVAGTLLAVGRGEMGLESVARAIETADRSLAGETAPAHGLTLKRVYYEGVNGKW